MTVSKGAKLDNDLINLLVGETGKEYFPPFLILSQLKCKNVPLENTRPNDTVLPIFSALWYFYYNDFVDTLPIMVRNTPTVHMWEYNKTAIAVLKEIGLCSYIPIKNSQPPEVNIGNLPFVDYMNGENLADLMFKMNLTNYFAHNIPQHKYRIRLPGIQKLYASVLGEIKRFVHYPVDQIKKDFNLRDNASLFWYASKLLICGDEFIQVPTFEHSNYVYKLTVLFGVAWKKQLKYVYKDLGRLICSELTKIHSKNELLEIDIPETLLYKDLREIRSVLAYNMGFQVASKRYSNLDN